MTNRYRDKLGIILVIQIYSINVKILFFSAPTYVDISDINPHPEVLVAKPGITLDILQGIDLTLPLVKEMIVIDVIIT